MEKAIFYLVHYGLAVVLPAVSFLKKPVSMLGLWLGTAFSIATMAFLFLWGQWPLVGSYYARYLPAALAAAMFVLALLRTRTKLPLWPPRIFGSVVVVVLGCSAGFVICFVVLAFAGRWHPERGIDLQFPLKGGNYFISSGGSSRTINNHMRDFPNAQEFAIDIHKLGVLGGASSNIFSSSNEYHHIFGEPVYSPCAGTVRESKKDVPDNAGTSMDVDAEDGSGNHLSIVCDNAVVSLMHLQHGSVLLEQGERVEAGQEVGKVGNSGFSQEPHLHLQAAVRNDAGRLVGIPMRFGDRSLARNDISTSAN